MIKKSLKSKNTASNFLYTELHVHIIERKSEPFRKIDSCERVHITSNGLSLSTSRIGLRRIPALRTLSLTGQGSALKVDSGAHKKLKSVMDDVKGSRYVPGGVGPDEFDCSGLVYYVFNESGIYEFDSRLLPTRLILESAYPCRMISSSIIMLS